MEGGDRRYVRMWAYLFRTSVCIPVFHRKHIIRTYGALGLSRNIWIVVELW